MIRVLHLLNAGHLGGGNQAMLTLWKAAKDLGVKPLAVLPEDGPMLEVSINHGAEVAIRPIRAPNLREPVSSICETRFWKGQFANVDVIHANGADHARAVLLGAKLSRTPLICHVHFHEPEEYCHWIFRGLPKPVGFIYPSQSMRTQMEPLYQVACPKAWHEMIYNAVDTDTFSPPARKSQKKKIVASVANLIPVKGHKDFIEMASLCKDAGHAAEYWIIGSDVHGKGVEQELKAKVEALGLEKEVLFLGKRSDVPELLKKVHVLVCASHEEPFGICLTEAMSSGVPVIGTRVGGIPEVIGIEEKRRLSR